MLTIRRVSLDPRPALMSSMRELLERFFDRRAVTPIPGDSSLCASV
jgi:hypothetical protein